MPITALGALKSGCAYQPLDSTYPPERLNFMVKDSAAKILIITKNLRNLITDYDGEILFTDEIPSAENFSLPEIQPDDIFILLYLGISSISAIKLSTKIYKKFGVNIPVKKLLGGTVKTIENDILQNWMSVQLLRKSAVFNAEFI